MTKIESIIKNTPLDITDPIQFGAEEYWCAMKMLDDINVPRSSGGKILSLVGRITYAMGQSTRS